MIKKKQVNGRYVQVCPPDGGRKEGGHMYNRKSVCFYEKQTPLQYLHPLVSVTAAGKQRSGGHRGQSPTLKQKKREKEQDEKLPEGKKHFCCCLNFKIKRGDF